MRRTEHLRLMAIASGFALTFAGNATGQADQLILEPSPLELFAVDDQFEYPHRVDRHRIETGAGVEEYPGQFHDIGR